MLGVQRALCRRLRRAQHRRMVRRRLGLGRQHLPEQGRRERTRSAADRQILAGHGWFYDSTFQESDLGNVATIAVDASDRLRVVVAWDQCPGYSSISPELNVDFDMVIDGPPLRRLGPRLRRYNLSDFDNYEVVEFTAPVGATYTVRVSAPRWHGCAAEGGRKRARFAAAWTKEPNPPVTTPVAG